MKKNSSFIHLSKDFLVWQAEVHAWPRNNMFRSLFSEESEFLYVFRHEQEALIGAHCPLKSMECIAYLCFVAARIDLSASKFHVHVCVSVCASTTQSGRD